MIALSCYIDDSGIDVASPLTVIGGPVFFQKTFFSFEYEWYRTLARHKIVPPIHMNEFATGGRLDYLAIDERRALFHDLAGLINLNKFYSITVQVETADFKEFFPSIKYKKLFGAAPMAFFSCIMLNHINVRDQRLGRIAYVVAKSDSNGQMLESHSWWCCYEEHLKKLHTGPITFDTPVNVNALQAADMIAWSNRRKRIGKLARGFEPLELLTRYVESDYKPGLHFHFPVKRKTLESLAKIVDEGIPIPPKIGRLDMSGLFFDKKGKSKPMPMNVEGESRTEPD